MSICDIKTKELPGHNLYIEERVYEDGYWQVALVDGDGLEMAETDGNDRGGNLTAILENAADAIITNYFNQ